MEEVLEMLRRADGMSLLDKGKGAQHSSGAVTSSLTQKFSQKLPCPVDHTGVKVLWRAGGIRRQNQ